jgi:hypothetical protein
MQNRLRYKGAPLQGYDYLLYRVEGRLTRDDWRLPDIDAAIGKAHEAYLKLNLEEGRAYKVVALTAAVQSPYLAKQDRIRVTQAIKDELKDYEAGTAGAVPSGAAVDLAAIVAARAMPVEQALRTPDVTFADILAG